MSLCPPCLCSGAVMLSLLIGRVLPSAERCTSGCCYFTSFAPAYIKSKMAAGDNSGRAPCLNFSSPGPLGNVQPSNSPYAMAASNNSGSTGPTGGAQGVTRRSNPQPGPNGVEGGGVAAGNPPNIQNALQLPAVQSAAVSGQSGGAMAASATNMTGTASNAALAPPAPPSQSAALSAPPAAAAVLVYREPVYNWQATKSTVKERFAFLFNNEVLSDVHFLVGKGMGVQRIPAHR